MTTQQMVENVVGAVVAIKVLDVGMKIIEPKKKKGKQRGFL
jgi:hypothetical protein